jgi:hypothetical protein
MGMFRDSGSCEIDIVKEMAEGLGSTGLKLEDLLEKAALAREEALRLTQQHQDGPISKNGPEIDLVNESIRNYNKLVDQAEDTLSRLLIQREACGFRTHRNVNLHYPIPRKMKLVSQ